MAAECKTAHELSPFPRGPAEYEVWLNGRWLPYCGLCTRAFHADLPRRPLGEEVRDGR